MLCTDCISHPCYAPITHLTIPQDIGARCKVCTATTPFLTSAQPTPENMGIRLMAITMYATGFTHSTITYTINLKIRSSIISYFETNSVMMIYALHSQGVWGISTHSTFLINNRNGSSSVSHYVPTLSFCHAPVHYGLSSLTKMTLTRPRILEISIILV